MTEKRQRPARRPARIDLSLLVLARFVSLGIVGVLASLVASLYYVSISGPEAASEVMRHRPDAPGSAAAILASHSDHCWTTRAPANAVVTGALLREHPNDPYRYVSSVHRPHQHRLFVHALEQAIEGKPRGIDAILAFCGDPRPTKEHT